MAISFVGAGAVGTGGNTVAAVPAGIQKNDLLLIAVTNSSAPTTPAGGWTVLNAQGAGQFLTVYFKFASASETSAVVTGTASNSKAVMVAYRGAGGVEARPAFTSGTGTTATPNTLTTTYSNDYVISLYACANGGVTNWTANASTTSRVNSAGTATVNGLLIADELKAAAGASTARAATLSASRAWAALPIAIIEDNRNLYWVGGNGTWDASTTTRWSNTSGGAGGAAAPSLMDNAIVDASSGSPTITLSGTPFCGSLTTTGATCTLSSTGALTVNGGMTLSATTTWSATDSITFVGTGTITTNGVSITASVIFNGAGQTFTLGSQLTTLAVLNLTSGALVLNGFNLNCRSISSTNSNTRSIAFGSNDINITVVTQASTNSTAVNMPTTTNFSYTGTGKFNLTGAGGSATGTRSISIGSTGGTAANAVNISVSTGLGEVSTTTGSWVNNLDFTGFSSEFSSGSGALNVAGSLTLVPAMTWSGTGTVTFRSTTTGRTITTAGKTLGPVTFNGVGGAWTLQSNLTSSGTINLTAGSLTTNNNTVDATTFSSNNTNVRTLNLGSSTINLSSTITPWNFETTTNLTFNAGTSQINLNGGGGSPEFQGGGLTYFNVNYANPTLTFTMFGNNTFNTLSSPGSGYTLILTGTTQTVTNFNVDGASYSDYITLTGGTLSKSSGTASLSFAQISTAATGGATWNAFGCQQTSAAATGWNFGIQTRFLIGSGAIDGFNTANRWSTTSGGSVNAMFPARFDDVRFDANSGSVTFTIDESEASIKSLDTTGFTGTLATDIAGINAPDLFVYGNFIVGSSTTFTSGTPSFVLHLSGTSSGNVLTMGSSNKNLNGNLTLNCSSGSYTVTTNITVNDVALTSGTLSFGSNTITTLALSDASSTGVTLNLNSSIVNIRDNVRLTDALTTFNAGTSTVNLTSLVAGTRIFNSNKTFNIVNLNNIPSGVGAIVAFNGSPTISRLTTNNVVGGYTLEFTSASTTTIGQFDIRGTAGNLVTVNVSSTTNATLASLGGAVQSNIDYISFFQITATPTPTATGTVPYYWYVGANSTQDTTTTGLVFSSDTSYTYYNLSSGTSWSVPANWNNSDNNVYLIGGGGGGSGSVVASATGSHNSGSGGGGGGFTALTNTTLTAGGTVSYAIGAAGANGAGSTSSSTAGGGGTTTFNISNTAGGGGGAATGLGTRSAGTAGTGSTFNGGAGGLGTAPNTNTSNASGGGAGSGGLDGAGVNGGANSGTTAGTGGAGNANLGDYLFVSGARYGDGAPGNIPNGAGVNGSGFGGGGGGGGTTAGSSATRSGGLGTQGVIVVRYRLPTAGNTGNFLTFFYQ